MTTPNRKELFESHVKSLIEKAFAACVEHGIPFVACCDVTTDEDRESNNEALVTSAVIGDRVPYSRTLASVMEVIEPQEDPLVALLRSLTERRDTKPETAEQ